MRTYVNSDIYNALPIELRNGIINTKVVSNHGSSDTNNFTSNDKLYLLDLMEIYNYNYAGDNSSRQLDYYNNYGIYEDVGSNSITTKKYNNTNKEWWTRVCAETNNRTWYYVAADGTDDDNDTPDNVYGVSPAFRIG